MVMLRKQSRALSRPLIDFVCLINADTHAQYAYLHRTFNYIVHGIWVVSEYISYQLHALTEASLQFPKSKVQTYKYHFAGGYGDVLF